MKFYVITIALATPAQRNAVAMLFNNKPQYGYWHWTSDFWLLYTTDDSLTAAAIRDLVKEAAPGIQVAVFGVEPLQDWALYSDPKWAPWLRENWNKPPSI